jgi:hypothetical protein
MFIGILKAAEEKSRIQFRLRNPVTQIRGSGSASKRYGSGTLLSCLGVEGLRISLSENTYLELLVSLGEDDKLGHEGDVDGLLVEIGGHLGGLRHVATVHQPESRRDLANTQFFSV